MADNPLLAAAEAALKKGWYVFAAPARTKSAYKDSKGSRDAVNDDSALLKWKTHPDSNPCVRLDWSGMTVLDADKGLASLGEAEEWAKRNGIPPTYIVTTGRAGGGFHFYFKGTRELPDVIRNPDAKPPRVGFVLDGVAGDIKCHGHVVAAGGVHKSGAIYISNGRHVAPLPQVIRDYEDPATKKKRQEEEAWVTKYSQGKTDSPKILIPVGQRHDWLLSEGGVLRQRGLEEKSIYLGLIDLANRFCVGGAARRDSELKGIAKFVGDKPCDRRLAGTKSGLVIKTAPPTARQLVTQFVQGEYPVGCKPTAIHAMLARTSEEFPNVPERTRRRAIEDAGLIEVGRDPNDNRIRLWTRRVPAKS